MLLWKIFRETPENSVKSGKSYYRKATAIIEKLDSMKTSISVHAWVFKINSFRYTVLIDLEEILKIVYVSVIKHFK